MPNPHGYNRHSPGQERADAQRQLALKRFLESHKAAPKEAPPAPSHADGGHVAWKHDDNQAHGKLHGLLADITGHGKVHFALEKFKHHGPHDKENLKKLGDDFEKLFHHGHEHEVGHGHEQAGPSSKFTQQQQDDFKWLGGELRKEFGVDQPPQQQVHLPHNVHIE